MDFTWSFSFALLPLATLDLFVLNSVALHVYHIVLHELLDLWMNLVCNLW